MYIYYLIIVTNATNMFSFENKFKKNMMRIKDEFFFAVAFTNYHIANNKKMIIKNSIFSS